MVAEPGTVQIVAHPFPSERPITTLKEDVLGRKKFAEAIADAIANWTGRDSLVVALYGPWGSGKTSLKNMVLDALSNRKPSCAVVNFDPWEWSGQQLLFQAFFRELGYGIGESGIGGDPKRTAKLVRMYAAMLSFASFLLRKFRILIVALLTIIAWMGITSPRFHANWYQQTLLWTGIIATLAAAVLAFSAEAASKLYVYLDAKAEAAQPGLHEIKRQLAESLAKLNRPVLVVTDDIDRLTPGQIRLVFQLVKANGDFPNLIYLLLFDKPFIEKAIATDGVSDGSAFLDKIVQVGFDIPHISPHQLDAALEDTVRKIVVAASEINERFDPFRWARTFPRIRPYFHTLRDVKRFAGSLEFQVQLFREGGHFNANPIDLIGLETLRQFEGTLYSRIPSTRAALTGESSLDFHIGDDDRQKAVKALLSEAKDAPSAQEIVEDLFPIAGMITSGGKTQGGLNLQWFKELRVAHPDNFERYFRLTLSSDDISEAEFAQLLSATFNAEKLTAMLRDFAGRGLLVTAIVRLRAELGNLSIDNIVPVMTALFDVERELMNVRQNASMGSVPVDFLALGLISGYLRRIDDRTKRAGLLRDAVSQTEGFILPCLAFEPAKDASADPLIETDELPRFRDLCLGKIRSAAASGALLSHPKRGNASYFWREWTGAPAEVGDWMNTVVNSDAGLAAILTALTEGMNIVEGSRVAQTKWMFNLDELSKYIDPEALASSAADLKSKSADEFVRTACETFLEELEARRKGERTKNRHPSELV